eukprot:m.224194 g.224194  ORF g.224194 m.224194 type:complete len:67 (+) comp10828_c7_seq1:938-1138(+)
MHSRVRVCVRFCAASSSSRSLALFSPHSHFHPDCFGPPNLDYCLIVFLLGVQQYMHDWDAMLVRLV